MVKHLAHTLAESFEYVGRWWLPPDPEDKIDGKLTFDQEHGVRLELSGAFRSVPFPTNRGFHCDFINGFTDNGVECTLIDNYESAWKFSAPGFLTHGFLSNLLVLGHYYTSHAQMQFAKCLVNYDHLEEWISPQGFDIHYTHHPDPRAAHEYVLRGRTQEYFHETLQAGTLRLRLSSTIHGGSGSATKATLEKEAFLEADYTEARDFEAFRQLTKELAQLLSVFMGDITWPRKLHLIPMVEEDDDVNGQPRTVSIFYRLGWISTRRRPYHFEMPVDFQAFSERLPAIVENWLSPRTRLQAVRDLFFSTLYSNRTNYLNGLLNFTHAADAFHRERFGGNYVPKGKFKRHFADMKRSLPDTLPADLRESVLTRLRYANEYPMRERLRLLLTELDGQLRNLVTQDVPKFVKRVIDTRNYYVHYSETRSSSVMEPPEILAANRRLELLLRIMFMRDLGFTDQEIYQMLHNKRSLLPWD